MVHNNFLPNPPKPTGQKQYEAVPRVKVFVNTDPPSLELDINSWINTLANPADTSVHYAINDIDYAGAQTANNVTEYSALVRYTHWYED